jgi:hypothetical protein
LPAWKYGSTIIFVICSYFFPTGRADFQVQEAPFLLAFALASFFGHFGAEFELSDWVDFDDFKP